MASKARRAAASSTRGRVAAARLRSSSFKRAARSEASRSLPQRRDRFVVAHAHRGHDLRHHHVVPPERAAHRLGRQARLVGLEERGQERRVGRVGAGEGRELLHRDGEGLVGGRAAPERQDLGRGILRAGEPVVERADPPLGGVRHGGRCALGHAGQHVDRATPLRTREAGRRGSVGGLERGGVDRVRRDLGLHRAGQERLHRGPARRLPHGRIAGQPRSLRFLREERLVLQPRERRPRRHLRRSRRRGHAGHPDRPAVDRAHHVAADHRVAAHSLRLDLGRPAPASACRQKEEHRDHPARALHSPTVGRQDLYPRPQHRQPGEQEEHGRQVVVLAELHHAPEERGERRQHQQKARAVAHQAPHRRQHSALPRPMATAWRAGEHRHRPS